MNLLIEYQYLSSVILFKNSFYFSHIIFEQYEFYQKMSFRNRCVIAGANGVITLSIPLADGRDQKKISKDVRIANAHHWQDQHWKTIVSCYNKSPWFEFYKEELHELYLRKFSFLVDWNLACFEWIVKKLELPISYSVSSYFAKQYDATDDWRNKILPRNYTDFKAVKYRQVFEERIGFLPNLSILDLLFCEGKGARSLLAQSDIPEKRTNGL